MSGLPGEDNLRLAPKPVRTENTHPLQSRPMTPSLSEHAEPPVDVDAFRLENPAQKVTLSPAEQTVKRLEKPLVRLLDENPELREKIDNINLDNLAENVTERMGNYRVSIHNAYNRVPKFIDNMVVKQLDPQMQEPARQLFDWIRKSPTRDELNALKTGGGSAKRSLDEVATEEPPRKGGIWPFRHTEKPPARHIAASYSNTADWDALLREMKDHKLQTSRSSMR